jgi:alkanesulfonate monooxygenase SsuD/methylene tetrahydromethanopterin reductase-like flavin-dependent oxidoreductase (luciferase family)
LATAAAATERVIIGASVFVPALRPVVLAAKQLASLQLVSAGRLVVGIGSGGGPGQWAAAGVPYTERGRRTDDALRIIPRLLAGEEVVVNGHPTVLEPAVARPPFWIGNASRIAIRRAAEFGDGWFPSLVPPAAVRAGAQELADLSATPPTIAVGVTGALGAGLPTREELEARIASSYGIPATGIPITGAPQQVAARFHEFIGAGAHHIVMGISAGDWRDQISLIAEARSLLREPTSTEPTGQEAPTSTAPPSTI